MRSHHLPGLEGRVSESTRVALPQLERFKKAQDRPGAGFERALAEMRTGCKRGHWIWYVFPQLAGLGSSVLSHTYAVSDVAEAEAFLRDPVLRSRLLTITTAVAERVRRDGVQLEDLMSSSIDVLKLVSSLTLFGTVARRLYGAEGREDHASLACMAEEVLAAAAAEGYPPCEYTCLQLGV